MRALKLLVIVMGVLIVVGVVVLVATLAGRMANRGTPSAGLPGFGRTAVELPAGATVTAMQGIADRIVLWLELPGGGQQLLVIDPGSGKPLGTIELRPSP
jgi:hypothetical protein